MGGKGHWLGLVEHPKFGSNDDNPIEVLVLDERNTEFLNWLKIVVRRLKILLLVLL